jgi:hypothetical protein
MLGASASATSLHDSIATIDHLPDPFAVRSRPILLKNSIRVFQASILGVSNHHPINLRALSAI